MWDNIFIETMIKNYLVRKFILYQSWSYQGTPYFTTALYKKVKLSIIYFFSICDPIHRKLWVWSHLLKKLLMEYFIFCAAFLVINHWKYNSQKRHRKHSKNNFTFCWKCNFSFCWTKQFKLCCYTIFFWNSIYIQKGYYFVYYRV